MSVENWLEAAGAASSPPQADWTWRYVWVPNLARKTVAVAKRWIRWLLPQSAYERLRLLLQKVIYCYPPDASPILIFPFIVFGITIGST